jgi:hypothetical protein
MIDRNKGEYPPSGRAAKLHLEESLASGRITKSEAEVIAHFFASPTSQEWPSSGLQKRMQTSGAQEPFGPPQSREDSERKS